VINLIDLYLKIKEMQSYEHHIVYESLQRRHPYL
jgi:hypothetical protein